MTTPSSPGISTETLAKLVEAMHEMRDALLNASLLLQDHLYETDHARRQQANAAAEELIKQARSS